MSAWQPKTGARYSVPERCNRPAWRQHERSGMRLCWDHARVNDPQFVLHENAVGPCNSATSSAKHGRSGLRRCGGRPRSGTEP